MERGHSLPATHFESSDFFAGYDDDLSDASGFRQNGKKYKLFHWSVSEASHTYNVASVGPTMLTFVQRWLCGDIITGFI